MSKYYILRVSTGETYSKAVWLHHPEFEELGGSEYRYVTKPHLFNSRREAQDVINILAQLKDKHPANLSASDILFRNKITIDLSRMKEEYEIIEIQETEWPQEL